MKFVLEIELGNDAMQTAEDVAEAIRSKLKGIEASTFNTPEGPYNILDRNGNPVGKWEVIESAPALPAPAVVPTCPKCGSHSVLQGWNAKGEVVAEFGEPASVTTFDDRIYMCTECGHESNWSNGEEFRPEDPDATGK
jgi:endogenous inhibitor of DNA gyrase (YacG/DUF329 family)